MILGEMEFTLFSDSEGNPISLDEVGDREDLTKTSVPEAEVEKAGDTWVLKSDPSIKIDARSHKMSKSRGNVVNPDKLISSYGADATRLFLMFLCPIEDMKPWNTQGIEGVSRFLRRLWREVVSEDGGFNPKLTEGVEANKELDKLLHETIKKVTEDIERLNFNTVVSQLMILLNQMVKTDCYSKNTVRAFLQMLNPMAPHISEELWARLGGNGSICNIPWPKFDESKLILDEVKVILQVNGKHRGELMVANGADKESVETLGLNHERVQKRIEGKTIRKVIYVPGKILNIVAN